MKCTNLRGLLGLLFLAVLLSACHKERECSNPSQKSIAVTAFDKVVTGETFKIHIVKGAAYTVTAKGCDDDLADLDAVVNSGRALKLSYKNFKRNRSGVEIEITMPELLVLDAGGTTQTTISGMSGQLNYMRFVLSGTARCSVNDVTADVLIDLSGASELSLAGSGTDVITGDISGTATLNAYSLRAKEADLTANGVSRAYVMAADKLYVEAGGASKVYYKGNPAKFNATISGAAKVIRQ